MRQPLRRLLSKAGYQTAISAKWHLGDHYPLRPIDRGFHESLIAKDAIVAGIANAPNNSLFNPILYHNEKPVKTQGYITDISFNAAMDFIEASRGRPFFVYLPTNVVHTPLEVAPHYSDPFKAIGLDDYTATLYGEVVNLDENVGRLQAKLAQLGIAENTIILYTVDNGPIGLHGVENVADGAHRYNLGLRAGKNTVWEGGIKLPFFWSWPANLPAGRKCEQIVSHIDVLPTVLEMCGVEKPRDLHVDGRSLLPLMKGRGGEWPERTLFFQQTRPDTAHRVYADAPRPFVNCAARGQKYKIVMASSKPGEMYFDAGRIRGDRTLRYRERPGRAKQHRPRASGNCPEDACRIRGLVSRCFEGNQPSGEKHHGLSPRKSCQIDFAGFARGAVRPRPAHARNGKGSGRKERAARLRLLGCRGGA